MDAAMERGRRRVDPVISRFLLFYVSTDAGGEMVGGWVVVVVFGGDGNERITGKVWFFGLLLLRLGGFVPWMFEMMCPGGGGEARGEH